jgi:glutamine amidotransferase
MHNGVIGDWSRVRRRVEALIPDELYGSRVGTTDSEAVFLALMGAGLDRDPIAATASVMTTLTDIVGEKNEALRFTAALADGRNLYAFRYAANEKANTLYYSTSGHDVVIVSEPLDTDRERWKAVPPGHMVVARYGCPVEVAPFLSKRQLAAE